MKRSLIGGLAMLTIALGMGADIFITTYHTEHSIFLGLLQVFGSMTPFLASGILLILHEKRLHH